MVEQPNVSRVRAAVAAYGQGPEGIAPFLSDDILWHVGGSHPLSGDYRGRDLFALPSTEATAGSAGPATQHEPSNPA